MTPDRPDPVAALWERFRPLVTRRIDVLEAFAVGAPDVTADDAHREAHNLAGALGSYGRAAGSVTARSVLTELDRVAAGSLDERRAALLPLVERLRRDTAD